MAGELTAKMLAHQDHANTNQPQFISCWHCVVRTVTVIWDKTFLRNDFLQYFLVSASFPFRVQYLCQPVCVWICWGALIRFVTVYRHSSPAEAAGSSPAEFSPTTDLFLHFFINLHSNCWSDVASCPDRRCLSEGLRTEMWFIKFVEMMDTVCDSSIRLCAVATCWVSSGCLLMLWCL